LHHSSNNVRKIHASESRAKVRTYTHTHELMAKIRLSDNISEFIYLFRKEALFHQKRKKRKEA
jgi:hypothetical protein